MKLQIPIDTTSKRIGIFVLDSSKTDGSGLAGLTSASAGLSWSYWREDAGNAGADAIGIGAGVRGTWSSGGFVEKDAALMPGVYEIGVPNAVLATGASWAIMFLKGAVHMAPVAIEIQLMDPATGGVTLAELIIALAAQTVTILLDVNAIPGNVWSEALPGGYGGGEAGQIVGDNLNATVGSRAAAGDQMDLINIPNAVALEAVADALLKRDLVNVEATAPDRSLHGACAKSVNRIYDDGAGHIIVCESDDATELYRQDIVTDPLLDPIEDIGGAT